MKNMKCLNLNNSWILESPDGSCTEGSIPGSVYSFLLNAGKMPDPFWRDNELEALKLMEEDYSFKKTFHVDRDFLSLEHQVLRFEGIDTIADVFLNGNILFHSGNMHTAYEADVRHFLENGENTLTVCTKSPTKFIKEADEKYHLGGSVECMRGFPHLRKAHCMFGWDWGPRLPDQGIWKDVKLLGWNESRILDVKVRQRHFMRDGQRADGDPRHAEAARNGEIDVELTVKVYQTGKRPVRITLTDPDGRKYDLTEKVPFRISSPKLWWVNGLGGQPLYELRVSFSDEKEDGDEGAVIKRIGLRTAGVVRKPDRWGETFAMEINGQTFFAMGADYIPEDSILSRMSRRRTERLLSDCAAAHFNTVRVWGGGIYPSDDFFDICDEKGLLVWEDLMFACANYRLTDVFVESIREEIRQNVRRIRHHASLGLWCGNNEMEQFALEGEFDGDDVTRADYLVQNEYIIPQILKEEDPDTFYWPSSPSSGGKFVNPRDPGRGDVHYWDVWHAGVPFTEYRKFCFRFLSEFGFQAFPVMRTIESFTEPEDRNVFSYVMEMHQRNSGANGKILQYLSQTYLYPESLELLVYASQLLQMDAIRYGVEHFRRNRNEDRCMGAVYWQLNDIWPVASWASIDYFGRWKALHYAAKRFFAPVMLSCEESGEVTLGRTCISEPERIRQTARLCLCNETADTVTDVVEWEFRDASGEILCSGEERVEAGAFSSKWLPEMDASAYDRRTVHLSFRLREHGSFGSVLFTAPKHYCFRDPKLSLTVDEGNGYVTVHSEAYAKSVEIWSDEGDVRLEDNFFDMEKGSRTIRILEGAGYALSVRSVFDIGCGGEARKSLSDRCCTGSGAGASACSTMDAAVCERVDAEGDAGGTDSVCDVMKNDAGACEADSAEKQARVVKTGRSFRGGWPRRR